MDDGTMVVVDNARKMINQKIEIVVTSVLQTAAGKMIFGRSIDQMTGTLTELDSESSEITKAPARGAVSGE